MSETEGGAEVGGGDASDKQNLVSSGPTYDAALSAEIESAKARGANCFQEGKFEEAVACYAEAYNLLEEVASGGFPSLRATLASNQALCFLKLERFAEAEVRASSALAADPSHGKAMYRRGLARLRLGDVSGAYEDLQRCSRMLPNDRDVRQRWEEVQRLAEKLEPDAQELVVAKGAAGVLGGSDAGGGGGLYNEKPDLNEGRLAETHKEQREWVQSIGNWTEMKDIAFSDDGDKGTVSVYMTLPGVQDIPPNKVCVWMQPNSLEVRVIDLRGENWSYIAQELYGQIDPERSTYKIRRDKLSLKLAKRASARSWDKWEKLRRI